MQQVVLIPNMCFGWGNIARL
ncbi:unnamed protein product, partial [Didymodactylos carnosus]